MKIRNYIFIVITNCIKCKNMMIIRIIHIFIIFITRHKSPATIGVLFHRLLSIHVSNLKTIFSYFIRYHATLSARFVPFN